MQSSNGYLKEQLRKPGTHSGLGAQFNLGKVKSGVTTGNQDIAEEERDPDNVVLVFGDDFAQNLEKSS